MKLIEILISELPKRGGWPETASTATQDSDGEICFSSGGKHEYCTASWKGGEWTGDGFMAEHAIDYERSIITREQYEAALKKKLEVIAERQPITEPSWDGSGLPPVGCECEMQDAVGEFIPVDIIANHDGFAFGWNYDRHAVYFSDKRCEFRPIRSEADKKRDDALLAMNIAVNEGDAGVEGGLEAIYEAIAAGKIPGVKLED